MADERTREIESRLVNLEGRVSGHSEAIGGLHTKIDGVASSVTSISTDIAVVKALAEERAKAPPETGEETLVRVIRRELKTSQIGSPRISPPDPGMSRELKTAIVALVTALAGLVGAISMILRGGG